MATVAADDFDPFARHAEDVRSSLVSADPDEIKRSYRLLGGYLEQAYAGSDDVPVLSWPETTPVVVAAVPAGARRILDAGCGPNPATAIGLARTDRTIVVLDIGLGTVRLAISTGASRDATLLGIVGDVEHLPFRSGAFDALVCDDTIEHLPDDRGGIRELARVLTAAGIAVVATPNRWGLSVIARKARDRLKGRRLPRSAYYAADSHLREYRPKELDRLVGESLVVVGRHPVGWRGGPKADAASRLVAYRPFVGLSKAIVVSAKPRRT